MYHINIQQEYKCYFVAVKFLNAKYLRNLTF